ncbi:MAG: YfhO family protein [Ruminiclostridium sp.]|nr:YfhO family protein [Ruminiclostridium sp.]
MKSIGRIARCLRNFIDNADKADKWNTLICIGIYTTLFALFITITILPMIIESGSFLGGDGINQYYPFLLNFKECILSFFDNVGSGTFQLPMMNFEYGFGIDNIFTILNFLPFAPFYVFSIIVPNEHIALFLAIGTLLLTYLSGLSFIAMCRHFGKNLFYGGLFATCYVFCGNMIFTGALNPHFLYMYIAFPLFIIGADNIIKGKGWKLFSATVFWLSLSGFTLIVYTIPFVVLFAIVRSFYVHKSYGIGKIAFTLLKGFGAFVMGILMASVVIMPCVFDFLNSSRTSSIGFADLLSYVFPSAEYLNELFSPRITDSATGAGIGIVICFIILLTANRRHNELRIYSLGIIFLTALPLIRYGLNGFQYALCRWGFIPAMIMCYSAVVIIPSLYKERKQDKYTAVFCILLYSLGITLKFATVSNLIICIAGLVNTIPFTRRLAKKIFGKVLQILSSAVKCLKSLSASKYKPITLVLMCLVGCLIIFFAALVVMNKAYALQVLLLISALLMVALLLLSMKFRKISSLLSLITAVCFILFNILDFEIDDSRLFVVESNRFLTELSESEGTENYPDRYGCISREHEFVDSTSSRYNKDQQFSQALRYNIADTDIFKSSIDKNYMSLLTRCGQDVGSILSTGQVSGFAGKEVLYSLFGVDNIYSYSDSGISMYGLEPVGMKSAEIYNEDIYLYKNQYALPTGVIYHNAVSEKDFEAFNSAELPYAMMDSVYLEDYDGKTVTALPSYSKECDIDLLREFRGRTDYNADCYDNTITINNDVADSFLYLAVSGMRYECYPEIQSQRCTIFADDTEVSRFYYSNDISNWEWIYNTDFYTVSLGYFEENVNSLSFILEFECEDIKLYSIPAEVYRDAYNDRMKETMQNVSLDVNAISGNLTLSENGYLVVNYLYNDGWKAFIDGKETPVYKANEIFLGIPLTEGTHTVSLVYRTPLLYEGMVVSLIALSLFVILPNKIGKKDRG